MRPASYPNNRPDPSTERSRRCRSLLFLFGISLCASVASAGEPNFRDLSAQLPLQHVYDGGWEFYVGGGLAVFDCNDDAFPDIFAAGGSNPSVLLRNTTSEPGAELSFERLDSAESQIHDVIGAYPIDIDGDAREDLFVLRVGANQILKGLGDCRFEDATERWSIDAGDSWSTAFSATWEPNELWPTLAVGNYVDRDDPDGPFGTCDTHQLFRPSGQGYTPAEVLSPGYCTLSMLFTNWSGEARQDLWISNDRHYYVHDGREQLFSIEDGLREYTAEDGWQDHKLWGMGIASRDISGDGRPEIAVTSMADQKLFTLDQNTRQPSYTPVSYARGMTAHRPHIGDEGRPSTGWHIQFGDVDNDGRDDVFIAKGNVNQMPSSAMADPDNLLMQRADGVFEEHAATAGVASMERGRGAALADLNRDGLLDLVVVQRRAPLALYQNITPVNNRWLGIELRQAVGNRFAIGATIELDNDGTRIQREIQSGGGHAGGQRLPEHFGLGSPSAAPGSLRVRARWPDGQLSHWFEVEADAMFRIERQTDGSSTLQRCESACT